MLPTTVFCDALRILGDHIARNHTFTGTHIDTGMRWPCRAGNNRNWHRRAAAAAGVGGNMGRNRRDRRLIGRSSAAARVRWRANH